MPLRDHFHGWLDYSCDSLLTTWAAVTVQHLKKKLPPGYGSAPQLRPGPRLMIADFRAAWTPYEPTLAAETDLHEVHHYEVRVYDKRCGRRMVAAVEFVSPGNKDWPAHRRLFAARCAALLQQDVCVVIVDLVTEYDYNLYAELLGLLGHNDAAVGAKPSSIYAACCQCRSFGDNCQLEAWYEPLALGGPLPTLPLWLAYDVAVPLELEASYEQTCADLDFS